MILFSSPSFFFFFSRFGSALVEEKNKGCCLHDRRLPAGSRAMAIYDEMKYRVLSSTTYKRSNFVFKKEMRLVNSCGHVSETGRVAVGLGLWY